MYVSEQDECGNVCMYVRLSLLDLQTLIKYTQRDTLDNA